MILFVCVHNAGRSRMAEAFFNKMSHSHRGLSAGTQPAQHPHLEVVATMHEGGCELCAPVGII